MITPFYDDTDDLWVARRRRVLAAREADRHDLLSSRHAASVGDRRRSPDVSPCVEVERGGAPAVASPAAGAGLATVRSIFTAPSLRGNVVTIGRAK